MSASPASDHGRAAVQPLQRRSPASRADEIEPGHEPRSGTDAHDRASEEREPETRVDEKDHIADDSRGDREERDATRAEAIRAAARWQLDREERHEERGREQADCRERDAVVLGEWIGDGADVRDVPGQAGPDGESRGDPRSDVTAGLLHG